MDIESIQSICKKLPCVTEDIKWGNDLCFCIAGKMFCVVSLIPPFSVSLKVKDEEFDELISYEGLIPAPYVGRYKWVLVRQANRFSKKEWDHYIKQSYKLIRSKLSKKMLKQLAVLLMTGIFFSSCGSDAAMAPPVVMQDSSATVQNHEDGNQYSSSKIIIATFENAEMGDYFHLIFKDEKGNNWDFGDGKNNLGDYKLYDESSHESNKQYAGKKFEITWDSVMTEYYCCEGKIGVVKGKAVSIITLKQLE